MMRIAVCPGSFDPITLGHLDIIRRAAVLFDRVLVCVMTNGEKDRGMFSARPAAAEEDGARRLELARLAVADLPHVEAELWQGLLADYARQRGAGFLVKGVRCGADFDSEYQMAWINQSLAPDLETVLLPARPEFIYFSSTMAREMIRYGQDLTRYLPSAVAEEIGKGMG